MTLDERLKHEATRIAAESGIGRVTVDRVAAAAGTTKGGFFHHFPSKEALLQAILLEQSQTFEAEVERHVTAGRSYASALIETVIDCSSRDRGAIRMLVEAVAQSNDLAGVLEARVQQWQARLAAEGVPAERRERIRLALDGCVFGALLSPEGRVSDETATAMRRLACPDERELIAAVLMRGLEA